MIWCIFAQEHMDFSGLIFLTGRTAAGKDMATIDSRN
jgi:hypothetical protein